MKTNTSLTLAYAAGVNPGKWFERWRTRYPHVTLNSLRYDGDAASTSWLTNSSLGRELSGNEGQSLELPVDFLFARLPVDGTDADIAVIPLYEELSVVVAHRDHEIAAFEELELADIQDEPRLATAFDTPPFYSTDLDIAEVMATTASGALIAVVPHSLARLHARKDTVARVLTDGPRHPVGLVFSHAAKAEREELFEAFIGVVRGRTERSSRQPDVPAQSARPAKAKQAKWRQNPGSRKPVQSQQKRSRRGGRGR